MPVSNFCTNATFLCLLFAGTQNHFLFAKPNSCPPFAGTPSLPPSPLPSSSTGFAQSCWTHILLYLCFTFTFTSFYPLYTIMFGPYFSFCHDYCFYDFPIENKDNLGLTVFGSVCCTRRCGASTTTTSGNVWSTFSGWFWGF